MRSFPGIARSALLLLVLAACQADQEKVAAHLARGDAYLDEKKYAEAIIEYKNVIQIDPNHAQAHWGLARALINEKELRDGFWYMRETVRLDPQNLDAKLQFAQLSIYAGELEEALALADEALAADPQRVEGYLIKAQALEQLKRPDEALEVLEKGVEVAPEHDAALAMLANFHRTAGNRAAAEPLLRKRLELRPSFDTAGGLAAFLGQDPERQEEAETAWRQALDLAEGEEKGRAYAQLADFYFRQERFDDARLTLEEGIAAGGEQQLDLIYLLARFHATQGNQAEADALIERATEAAPDNPRPHLVLSAYRARKGDLDGALEAAEAAVRADPEGLQPKLRKAEVLVEQGYRRNDPARIAEGRAIAEAVLAEQPAEPGALFVRAKIEMAEGRMDDAAASLRSAIDVQPEWAQAHFVLGTALTVKGERTSARTELARALELDPTLTEAHQVLAQVHADLGEHEYAVEEARLYLRERPDAIPTRILLAQSLMRLRQAEEALVELRTVPEAERTPELHYAIGRILLAQGELDGARSELELAQAGLPDSPDVLMALLDLDRRQGRLGESRARITALADEKPESASLQRLKGRVLLTAGDAKGAEQAFERAVELDPNDVQGYQLLASYYQATGRTQETIQTFEKALAVDPDAAHIDLFLGVLYESAGQRGKAIEHYEAAIRKNPNLAEAKNNLAYVFAEGGENLDRALDLAQEAKALLPDNPSAADTLGWVLFKKGVPSAAVTYLKEAEGGFEPGDPSLGVVRVHLAQAYQANSQPAEAKAVLQRALADYEAQREERRSEGAALPPDPPWVQSARSMLESLGA